VIEQSSQAKGRQLVNDSGQHAPVIPRSDPTKLELVFELIDGGLNSLPNSVDVPLQLWRILLLLILPFDRQKANPIQFEEHLTQWR